MIRKNGSPPAGVFFQCLNLLSCNPRKYEREMQHFIYRLIMSAALVLGLNLILFMTNQYRFTFFARHKGSIRAQQTLILAVIKFR